MLDRIGKDICLGKGQMSFLVPLSALPKGSETKVQSRFGTEVI